MTAVDNNICAIYLNFKKRGMIFCENSLPADDSHKILYSYFMPACSIVKTITPRCCGRPGALLHEAEGRVHQVVHGTEG